MIDDPASELVGLEFITQNGGLMGGMYSSKYKPWKVIGYEDGKLLIGRPGDEKYSYRVDPDSFEAVWDMCEWDVYADHGRECVNNDMGCYYPPQEDDYICKWCRYNQALEGQYNY